MKVPIVFGVSVLIVVYALVGLGAVWLTWAGVRACLRRREMYRSIATEVRQRRQPRASEGELDQMLRDLSKLNWGTYAFPNRENPVALAYLYDHGQHTDVIILRGEMHVTAYRTPSKNPDVLAPKTVVWSWAGDPVMGVRTMLALPAPGQPGAPNQAHEPPPGFVGIHPDERGRLLYRPRQHRWL